MQARCETCHEEHDCRPYGVRGAMICYPCMKSSPEREREAERQLGALFRAAEAVSPVVVIDGVNGTGPRPLGGRRQ